MKNQFLLIIFLSMRVFSQEPSSYSNNQKVQKFLHKFQASKQTMPKFGFARDMWNYTYGQNAPISGDYIYNALDNLSSKSPKMVDTIFYLFSFGVNDVSFNNFFVEAYKLKDDLLYFGGLNGFPKENVKAAFYKAANKDYVDNKLPYKIKLTPYFYKDLNISEVPAYIFAKCPNKKDGSFKHTSCNYKYLLRGDITLTKALELLSSRDKYYEQYYRKLIIKE